MEIRIDLHGFKASDNPYLSGTIPENIGMLTNLGSLELSNTNVTGTIPVSIGNCTGKSAFFFFFFCAFFLCVCVCFFCFFFFWFFFVLFVWLSVAQKVAGDL